MIGIIVMVFQIAAVRLADSVNDRTSTDADSEVLQGISENGTNFAALGLGLRDVQCSLTTVLNSTGVTIESGNYTYTNCNLAFTGADITYNNTNWVVNYSYSYIAENDAGYAINETRAAISTSTDFFSTFIVIGAMIVLVLLVVVIINSLRGSGLLRDRGGA